MKKKVCFLTCLTLCWALFSTFLVYAKPAGSDGVVLNAITHEVLDCIEMPVFDGNKLNFTYGGNDFEFDMEQHKTETSHDDEIVLYHGANSAYMCNLAELNGNYFARINAIDQHFAYYMSDTERNFILLFGKDDSMQFAKEVSSSQIAKDTVEHNVAVSSKFLNGTATPSMLAGEAHVLAQANKLGAENGITEGWGTTYRMGSQASINNIRYYTVAVLFSDGVYVYAVESTGQLLWAAQGSTNGMQTHNSTYEVTVGQGAFVAEASWKYSVSGWPIFDTVYDTYFIA